MTLAAHIVLFVVMPAWLVFLWWLGRGPAVPDEWCDCRECREAFGVLEVWLEQPAREACHLDDDEQDAWQDIVEGAK